MLRDNIGRAKKKLMTLSNKKNSMPAGGSDEFSDYIGYQVVTKLTGVHVEDMLRDYTGRVKKKLRTLSNKRNSMPDGGSDEFSDYIGHVKNNFTRFPSTTATIYMEN
ncbi:hypothetical protein LINPERPRIM_LOCUS7073 [Linum perenne]